MLIGVFEYEETNESVFCSRSIFEMMGWAEPEEPYCYMSSGEFQKRMEEAIRNTKKDGVNYLFHINVSPASDDTGEAGVSGGPAAFSRGAGYG